MSSGMESVRRGVRVTYEHEEEAEQTEQSVRAVHRHTVTADSDRSFLLGFLAGGASTMAIVSVTAYLLKNHFGEIARPLAPNCVIYEVTVPKSKEKYLEEYVTNGSLKRDLQKSFENVEDQLRQVLGEEYGKVESNIVEFLKNTRIASVELCAQQKLQEAWKKFWQIQDTEATEAAKSVTLNAKVKKAFGGKISESKLKIIIQAFKDLGVDSPEDVAYLTTNDIAKQLEGALTLVELRKLMEFVKGPEIPLPPSHIRLSSAEYPNTALTVFFDDPNKTTCEYMVTARDMVLAEEISVKSDANFSVLKNLRPGRRYVIYAQCISNGVKSRKSFFSEPINVYGSNNETDANTEQETYPAKLLRGVQSAPTITDSAYQSGPSRADTGRDPEDDEASVLTISDMKLGEDAETNSKQAEDMPTLWKSDTHNALKIVFPGMLLSKMLELLKKLEEIGIQKVDDLQYLKDPEVAEELKETLKIVELKKFLEYVKEEKYKKLPGEISIGDPRRVFRDFSAIGHGPVRNVTHIVPVHEWKTREAEN